MRGNMPRVLAVICALAALPAVARAEDTTEVYPVIIVGSGYGGSIAAYNLSRRGIPNLVVERGRWWKVEDTTANEPFPIAPEVLNPNDQNPATRVG